MEILGLRQEPPREPVGQIFMQEGHPDIAVVDLGLDVSEALRKSWAPGRPFASGGAIESAWLQPLFGAGGAAASSLLAGNVFLATANPATLMTIGAVTRVATPETEQALLDVALAGTAAHVEQVVRTWRRVDRAAEAAEDRHRHESRALHTWVDDDGTVVVRGRLTPEVGAVLRRALDAVLDAAPSPVDPDGAAEDAADEVAPTIAQRRADALGAVAECALAGGLDKGTAGDRYQVVVHVDADTLADDGDAPEAAETAPHPSDGNGDAGTATDEAATRRPRTFPLERPNSATRRRTRQPRRVSPRLRPALRSAGRRGKPPVPPPPGASRRSTKRVASTSPRRRPGGWPATPPRSRCSTVRPARC